jgi:hypothetical protein
MRRRRGLSGAARTYVLVAILLVIGVGGALWWHSNQHKPGDLQYYKTIQSIIFDHSKPVDAAQLLKKIEAVPTADVNDPMLLDYHQKQIEFLKQKAANPNSESTKSAYIAMQRVQLQVDDDYGNVK